MNIAEVFYSIQGEGLHAGTPSVFVRCWGCDLRCAWCDTSYSYNGLGKWGVSNTTTALPIVAPRRGTSEKPPSQLTPQQVVGAINEHRNATHVVFTGGEPLLQQRDLLTVIEQDQGKHHYTVETNGMHFAKDLVPLVNLWSVSPKLPSSGMPFDRHNVLKYAMLENTAFKFVIEDQADLDALKDLMRHFAPNLANPIWLQPQASIPVESGGRIVSYLEDARSVNDQLAKLRWLADTVKSDPWFAKHCVVAPQLHGLLWGRTKGT